MIRFHQVTKRYPSGFEALRNLSFTIAKKEKVFLAGHSGAGKSTLLHLITAETLCTRGQVMVGGHHTATLSNPRFAYFRRHIGTVYQDHRLLADRSAFDNVALPMVVSGYHYHEIQPRVRAALKLVGLEKKAGLFPQMLSAGEQQRVGIARAVVNRPPLLIADEPTGNLDLELSWEIMDVFERLHQQGTTLLIATHNLELIHNLRWRTLVLKSGDLITDGYSGR